MPSLAPENFMQRSTKGAKAQGFETLRLCSFVLLCVKKQKSPHCGGDSAIIIIMLKDYYAFTLPFTLAITSSAMLFGAGE